MTHSRRCFLGKGSSVTATALLLLAGAQAWPEVQVIESPALRLSLDLAGGESSVEVKATGVRWPLGASVAEVTFVPRAAGTAPVVLALPQAEVEAVAAGRTLTVQVGAPDGGAVTGAAAKITFELDEAQPVVHVTGAEESAEDSTHVTGSICCPKGAFPLTAGTPGACLAIPYLDGAIVPMDLPGALPPPRVFSGFGINSLLAGCWGVCTPKGSVVGVFTDPYMALGYRLDGSTACIDAIAEALPLDLRLRFVEGGDYNAVASVYRSYVRDRHGRRPLADRFEEEPRLAELVGALTVPAWHVYYEAGTNRFAVGRTFQGTADIAQRLSDAGVGKALYIVTGYGQYGHDYGYPDILPVSRGAGGDVGLRALVDTAQALGHSCAAYLNYQVLFKQSPSYNADTAAILTPGGEPADPWGRTLRGGACCVLSSTAAVARAEADMPKLAAIAPFDLCWLDSSAAHPLFDNYNPLDRYDRRRDLANRLKLGEIGRAHFPLVGYETGADWCIPQCDYVNHIGWYQKWGVWVPLYALIYHDPALMAGQKQWWAGWDAFIDDIAAARSPVVDINDPYAPRPDGCADSYDTAVALYDTLTDWATLAASSPSLTHRFLNPSYSVEMTACGDEGVALVNRGPADYAYAGGAGLPEAVLPEWGFIVRTPGSSAYRVASIGKCSYDAPLWCVYWSGDGAPLDESATVGVYHVSGPPVAVLENRHTVASVGGRRLAAVSQANGLNRFEVPVDTRTVVVQFQ